MINEDQAKGLTNGLRTVRTAAEDMTDQLRRFNRHLSDTRQRAVAACSGGVCTETPAAGTAAGGGSGGGSSIKLDTSSLGGDLLSGLTKSVSSGLQGVVQSLVSSLGDVISGSIRKQSGGGLFGGLLGNLVGGGLDLLVDRLFPDRGSVEVTNTVQARIMNFPGLSDLGLATNPASRLLGGRSIARGPAFTVTVDYRNGAQDVIAAKVAGELKQLNELHGRF